MILGLLDQYQVRGLTHQTGCRNPLMRGDVLTPTCCEHVNCVYDMHITCQMPSRQICLLTCKCSMLAYEMISLPLQVDETYKEFL